LNSIVELDELYFDVRRVRGMSNTAAQGRGTAGKTIVFGLLKRDGNVYTESCLTAPKCYPRAY